MEFQLQEINAHYVAKNLLNLRLDKEQRTKNGDIAATWIFDGQTKAQFNFVFSTRIDGLPISIEIEPILSDGSKRRVWDSQIEWQSKNGRYYQKSCRSRDYFPDGKVYEIDLNFEWVLSPEIPKGFLDRTTTADFDPKTEQFTPGVSWIKECSDLFAKKP
jgi:hypothetical protein